MRQICKKHIPKKAYTYDRRAKVYGFSVQFAPGLSWQDLARAGTFPHAMVCYADRTALDADMKALGYELHLVPSPGQGYHHELMLNLAKNGTMLDTLPDDAAQALSRIFRQHLVPKPEEANVMQRIYVDFGKGIDGQVDIAYTGDGPLKSVTLHEDEKVILFDSSLEVQAVVHQDCSDGRTFWYAIPNWATQQNHILTPDQHEVLGA